MFGQRHALTRKLFLVEETPSEGHTWQFAVTRPRELSDCGATVRHMSTSPDLSTSRNPLDDACDLASVDRSGLSTVERIALQQHMFDVYVQAQAERAT
jgi:hypothetical protein